MGDLRTMVGKMRHRVIVKTIASSQETTMGSWTQAATTDSTRWASIEPISARERITAGQVVPEATHVIRMRWNTAVTPSATLVYGTRTFEVLSSINVNERDKILELLCKELV